MPGRDLIGKLEGKRNKTPLASHTKEPQPKDTGVGACLNVCVLGAGHSEQA